MVCPISSVLSSDLCFHLRNPVFLFPDVPVWLYHPAPYSGTPTTGGVACHEKSGVEVRNRKKRAEELLGIISDLGPAIIKAGQALSSRPDLLPKEYLDELQKLQVR